MQNETNRKIKELKVQMCRLEKVVLYCQVQHYKSSVTPESERLVTAIQAVL